MLSRFFNDMNNKSGSVCLVILSGLHCHTLFRGNRNHTNTQEDAVQAETEVSACTVFLYF